MGFQVSARAFVLLACGVCLVSVFVTALFGSRPTLIAIPPGVYATAFIVFQWGTLIAMAIMCPSGDIPEFCRPYLLFFLSTMSAAASHVAVKWVVNDEAPAIERIVQTSVALLIAVMLLVWLLQFWRRPNTTFWRSVRGYLLVLGLLRLTGTAVLAYSLGSVSCPPGDLTPWWAVVCNCCSLVPVAFLSETRRFDLANTTRQISWRADVRQPFFLSLQQAAQHKHDRKATSPEQATPRGAVGSKLASFGSSVQQLFWIGYVCFFGAFLLGNTFLVDED